MRPKFRKLERLGLGLVLAALAVWPLASRADEGGNRVLFPVRPLPVFNTNVPSAWASSNLTSVPISAGGNAVVRTNFTEVKRYPYNVYDPASTNEPYNYRPSYALAYSSFGHVVTGNRPDYYLGDPIAVPENVLPASWYVNWAAMGATNISPTNAIYEPSVQQLYAIAGGQVTITWVFTDGTRNTNVTRTYLVSGTPAQRPKRIYWTEPPYNAPTVNLQGRHVKFHWNNNIPAPTNYQGSLVRGLQVDASGLLHAAPGPTPNANPLQGMVVMQYFKTGDLREQVPGGVVVVEVRRPEVNTLTAEVGKRLLPKDDPYGYRGLDAHVTRGLEGTPAYVYKHQGQYTHSPKNGWAFGIRPSVDAPWMIEIYWEEADLMGTLWPYEADWYAAHWPADAQPYVRGSGGSLGADVLVSMSMSPKLEDAQDPPGHARLSADGVFSTTSEGYSLLKFTANDNVWFQAVHAVYHTNQMFGADPLRWPVGTQFQPNLSWDALQFDGSSAQAAVTNFPGFPTNEFTLECWLAVSDANNGKLKPILSRSWGTNAWDFLLAVNGNGWLTAQMQTTNPTVSTLFEVTGPALENNRWYHTALSVRNQMATLFVDGQPYPSTSFGLSPYQTNRSPLRIGWGQIGGTDLFFSGQLDEIRVWSKALTAAEAALARSHSLTGDVLTNLLAYYPMESDGTNQALCDIVRGSNALVAGPVFVQPGATPVQADAGFSADHGYVYDPPNRAPYNVALYHYPTIADPIAETYVFGVNSGRLEVWWAQKVQQTDMPEPVYFPAWACAYTNVWATNNAADIVLASNEGSPAFQSGGTASIYAQNNISLPGYNPNEEHALMGQDRGGWVAYALRDDLNTPQSSPPFVLVNYTDPDTDHPLMHVFHVIRTNAEYPAFAYSATVGDPLWGPRPLDLLINVEPTSATRPWTWRDRKLTWWAVGAGLGDTGTAVVMMTNWYPMQLGFWFPALGANPQPAAGTPIPWLPVNGAPAAPTLGTPLPVSWTLSWPTDVPAMKVGQTLTRATEGLPEIWNQASVDLAYQQSAVDSGDANAVSVRLFDPSVAQQVPFTESLSDYGFAVGPGGNSYTRQGLTYFYNLPPDLSDRFYYDPTRRTLRFIGRLVEPATGSPFLLVNRLSERQRDELKAICTASAKRNAWNTKIDALARNIIEVAPNQPFDGLALAAVGRGAGFVTLAFNNSTNVSEGLPISVEVIKVKPELYTGFLIPLKDQYNLLSEQMNILFSESFAGDADLFEFQWVAVDPPTDGTVPRLPSGDPSLPFAQENGLTRLRIGGQGATLQDLVNRFFTLRYRATDASPAARVVGTNWSDYADFALAEGWVQRVMFSINPFEQRLRDLYNNPTETHASMIQQAGRPYVGNVALNMDAINEVGLIELYQTVFYRAQRLSLDLGINSPAVNQQLLLAVSRLQALYMLLGNEAFADALDPTIGFGSENVEYGAFASSLFCFANQVPTLLDEELALLRGRGTPGLAPGVDNYPYYNRLVWNFTRGLDAGEVAYAVNYNIRSSRQPTITAETAAGLYPQGHGDAYGHYLSALKGYYHLLRNPNFNWGDPSITSLLLGYQTISADYGDENRFAETAAALARTGVEIARRASRKAYTESADSAYTSGVDSDLERAWGVTEWIGRTGMGAFYNWAIAQSLLPTSRVDVAIEGSITSISRSTVKAAKEIVAHYAALQRELDQVDQGLNPLGLARGAVPFDIDPTFLDVGSGVQGLTHFDQVYERAVAALANARTTFDAVQEATLLLRQQSETVLQFEQAVLMQELDYTNRLIEIFGYPYADDIGPAGTYAQGYAGPDLFHYMYVDLAALGFDKTTDIGTVWVTNFTFTASELADGGRSGVLPSGRTNVTFSMAANGLQIKPAGWTGDRRAEGNVQRAYREFLVALLEARAAQTKCANDVQRLTVQYDWYHEAGTGWYATMKDQKDTVLYNRDWQIGQTWVSTAGKLITGASEPLATVSSASIFEVISAKIMAGLWIEGNLITVLADAGAETAELEIERTLAENDFKIQDQERRLAILDLARNQKESASELLVALQKLSGTQAAFLAAVAEGERLLVERETFRTAVASRINSDRYNDMSFRIFRNDALRRYSDAFELAARYTYLAAKAYDYETGLLPSETAHDPGAEFMDEIIRARTIGRVADDQPVLGVTGIGEPGLADILARMAANWSVLRGRLGFNNPETETGRFSLRTELFRVAPGAAGDALWRQKLEQCKVEDLFALPEFRRDCLPFAAQGGLEEHEPGLVIPFSSTIDFAKNYFGRDLAGGDNAYDSSHFATKVRSVGVWFTDYDRVTDGSQNVYLANQPRVYLLPLGQDIMRSPTGLGDTLREWQVLDQAIPVPFPIGATDLDQPDWIPLYDTLTSPWAQARRYPSMRAYHDRGFDVSEMSYNSRLVGRSVWNTRWLLIIPAGTLHHDRANALDWFIGGATGTNGVSDIKLFFQTYSYAGN